LTTFSHSRLSAYENCPRQYEYRYVRKLPRETESIEAFVGKRVHEILERLYHHVSRHGRPPSLRQVQERYRKDWDLRWHPQVEIVQTDVSVDDYRERGRRCLENYYRSHYPFDRDETVGIEQQIELVLDADGRYRARGVIDRLVRTREGAYEIHDYKTGGSLPPKSRLDADRQLALYQIGVEQRFPDAGSVELVWHYLLFNRTLRSTRSPEQLEEVRAGAIGLIDEIHAATEFAPRPGPLCRWCEFRKICPEAALRRDEPPAWLDDAPPPAPAAAPGAQALSAGAGAARTTPLPAPPVRQLVLF
jgi:putative RecB family exonuclease